ncbi:MAG: XRE family transcriptional regulator [Puniceicoccaceae bacterium]|nr:MAG: XRE family transcriptional regulator [Puniceicoccaceae bacterium]
MTEAETLNELGRRIHHARVNAGLKQEELAEKAAISPNTLSRAESGKAIQTTTLFRILSAIGNAGDLVELLPRVKISPLAMQRAKKAQRVRVR